MADLNTLFQAVTALAASNPASTFIQKVSEYIEANKKPERMLRDAETEIAIDRKKAVAAVETEIEIKQLRERAEGRILSEELRKQRNIEAPIMKALPNIREDAKPEEMDDDWIANFFDKCRLVSNEEMQNLWGQILAGEANKPGTFSHRTINFLASLTQKEAMTFRRLCMFNWRHGAAEIGPIIFSIANSEYTEPPFDHAELQHLSDIGLIAIEPSGRGYAYTDKSIRLSYGKRHIYIEWELFKEGSSLYFESPNIRTGIITLTQVGVELAAICEPVFDDCVIDYACKRWYADGLILSSMLPVPRPPELDKHFKA